MKIYWKFLKSLLLHKWYVLRAGLFLGIPLWRLIIHDWTKFLPVEFFRYARNFFGDYTQSPVDRVAVVDDFEFAWLHHENSNPHHPGYWIPRTGPRENEPLSMPNVFIREMIADWMGASRAYTGSFDISAWLNENGPAMRLHKDTIDRMWVILSGIPQFVLFVKSNPDLQWCNAALKIIGGGKIE